MNPRLKKISRDRYSWQNCTGNVEVTPLRFFYPRNKEDIAEIVRRAEQDQLRVRAVGSGHSFSEAAKGKDYLLSMKHMSKVWRTPKAQLKEEYRHLHLATAEAGTVIKKLTRALDKMDLALTNMGVIDVQTISGALMTGTHGTGIEKPSIPDMVRSIKMVGTGGRFYQIEPSDGITDPYKYDHNSGVKLIQDDDIFYSTILSFGGMGIAYQVILEVVPQYWMREKRYLLPWSELERELLNGRFMQKVAQKDFVAFRVNPYEVKKDHRCAVVEQEIVSTGQTPKKFSALTKNLLFTVVSNLEYALESSIERFKKNPKTVERTIQLGLWATKDAAYFGKSYKVLYQGGNAVLRHGLSAEFAFEAHAEKIVEVMQNIFEQAQRNAREAGLYQSSYVSVRFVPPSNAYLSSAYNRKTFYVDVPLLYGTTGDIEILERYQKMMIGLGGIPHWGKLNSQLYLQNDFIREQFDMVDRWIAVRNRMDPKGTFLNDFIVKMGLGGISKPSFRDQMISKAQSMYRIVDNNSPNYSRSFLWTGNW